MQAELVLFLALIGFPALVVVYKIDEGMRKGFRVVDILVILLIILVVAAMFAIGWYGGLL